jgi:hypothetical protein
MKKQLASASRHRSVTSNFSSARRFNFRTFSAPAATLKAAQRRARSCPAVVQSKIAIATGKGVSDMPVGMTSAGTAAGALAVKRSQFPCVNIVAAHSMVSSELLVELPMQSRRVREGDGKKKGPNDSQRVEATRIGRLAPKNIPTHERAFGQVDITQARNFEDPERGRARFKKKLYPRATRRWHSAKSAS